MTKLVIYTNNEGGVTILTPTPDALKTMTIDEIATKDVPSGIDYEVIDAKEIPTDRYFRAAWRKNGKKIETDLDKARDIQMGIIRGKRNAKLAEQDIEWQRETEQGNSTKAKAVATLKQTLRDIHDTFDLTVATTPDELKALMPDDLID